MSARHLLFFFSRDLFPPAVSMWVPVHGAPASANTHGKAAAGGGRLPTRVGKEFVQGGFGPASTTLSAGGQFKQGCCKGSLRCDGQDATPPHDPRCPSAARREVGTSAARARASKRMKVAASGAHQPPTRARTQPGGSGVPARAQGRFGVVCGG